MLVTPGVVWLIVVVSIFMTRLSVIAVIFGSILFASHAEAPSDGKRTFAEMIEKLIVERNGEVVLDVRISTTNRWQQDLLDRSAPWRSKPVSPDAFRYVVIHEFSRYHTVQLDRDQKVLVFYTTHVEEKPLDASGPSWNKRIQKSQ
jgi:hypothetical protein